MRRLAIAILTCDRPGLFADTLADIMASSRPVGWEADVTVVDNSVGVAGRAAVDAALAAHEVARVVRPAYNVGIAAGWNLAWGAVTATDTCGLVDLPEVVALVQDDVRLVPEWFEECLAAFRAWPDLGIVSGYNSPCHPTVGVRRSSDGTAVYLKGTLPGVHLVAARETWEKLFPIQVTAHHLGEDYWFTRDAPGAPSRLGHLYGVIPGLVAHVGAGQSSWDSRPHPEYADPVREIMPDGSRSAAAAIIDGEEVAEQPVPTPREVATGGAVAIPHAPLMIGGYGTTVDGEALSAVFGFVEGDLRDARAVLSAGRPVLARGFTPDYIPLAETFPGRLAVTWHSGWTGAELLGEAPPLTEVLRRAASEQIKFLWMDGAAAELPQRAVRWRPIWHPPKLHDEGECPREPRAVALGPHANVQSLPAKNLLASVAALCRMDVEMHVAGATWHEGPLRDVLRELTTEDKIVVHATMDRAGVRRLLRGVTVLVHPSLTETWPMLCLEAVYNGTPAIVSPAVVWSERLPWSAREACVIDPPTATNQIRAAVRLLLSDELVREETLGAQRVVLDEFLSLFLVEDRRLLRECGFEVAVEGDRFEPACLPENR